MYLKFSEWGSQMPPHIQVFDAKTQYKEAYKAVAERKVVGKAVLRWQQGAKL